MWTRSRGGWKKRWEGCNSLIKNGVKEGWRLGILTIRKIEVTQNFRLGSRKDDLTQMPRFGPLKPPHEWIWSPDVSGSRSLTHSASLILFNCNTVPTFMIHAQKMFLCNKWAIDRSSKWVHPFQHRISMAFSDWLSMALRSLQDCGWLPSETKQDLFLGSSCCWQHSEKTFLVPAYQL